MGIWKRKRASGYVWMADYLDGDGRRHRVSAATRDAVDRLRAQKITERAEGANLLGDPELTVEQFARQWFVRLGSSDLKPRTVADYRWLYDHYILEALGPIRLRELRRTHVKEFLNAMRSRVIARTAKPGQTAPRTLSKNSVRLIRATLSAMLGEALDDELIRSNPAAVPSRRRGKKATAPSRAPSGRRPSARSPTRNSPACCRRCISTIPPAIHYSCCSHEPAPGQARPLRCSGGTSISAGVRS
jgi:integrase